MGFAAVLSNGPQLKIMLAIDFRGPFVPLFMRVIFILFIGT